MRASGIAAAALAIIVFASTAAARVPVVARPVGSVSGTVTARWTEVVRGDTTTRTNAAITFTVEDRLRAPNDAEQWVPQPQPDFVLAEFRGNYAYLLRARVAVDAFTRTV